MDLEYGAIEDIFSFFGVIGKSAEMRDETVDDLVMVEGIVFEMQLVTAYILTY